MSVVPLITANNILTITGINSRPVYFLTLVGQTSPTVTVKGEKKNEGGEVSIKWSSKLMKHVNDRQVNTKIMTDAEVMAFKQRLTQLLAGEPDKLKSLTEDLIWVKMPFVNNLSDADALKKNDQGIYDTDAVQIKTAIRKFAKEEVWYELGKVIAVDVFNGNGDRFLLDGFWQNQGNVMFQRMGDNSLKVIGLDTYDPNSKTSDLTKALVNKSDLDLLDPSKSNFKDEFATEVTKSVTDFIKRAMKNTKLGAFKINLTGGADGIIEMNNGVENLFDAYKGDLIRGIVAGTSELKQYLQTKVKSKIPLPVAKQAWVSAKPSVGTARPPASWTSAKPSGASVAAGGSGITMGTKGIPPGIIDRMIYLHWM